MSLSPYLPAVLKVIIFVSRQTKRHVVFDCFKVEAKLLLYVYIDSTFFLSLLTINILLFRETPQQLEELFVVVCIGNPGVASFLPDLP